jgi:branched-chain amino acid transport system permease protein
MAALGYNVTAHRVAAFAFAGLVAACGGVLAVWYNGQIAPGSIDLTRTIDVLVVAVIGGLYRLEGAWVGALTFALLDNYSREWTPTIGNVLAPERFNTLLGIIFLFIVLVSPGGLVGAWESGVDRLRRRSEGGGAPPSTTDPGHPTGGPATTTVK